MSVDILEKAETPLTRILRKQSKDTTGPFNSSMTADDYDPFEVEIFTASVG